ncbi:hypothetical protein B0A49_04736 [Cryomyces minteri]|uniref:HRDC domain-containing protein n=1 Tax=Cryomyces minteri TaxID=331657 RepID=A0A4U0X283_9PEZI|nr:hypothetical protein B0A49_11763 [Cryomyces minteri]TKA70372.1 hypothetical protein B0A49_04736 [Cryomyces minteri]
MTAISHKRVASAIVEIDLTGSDHDYAPVPSFRPSKSPRLPAKAHGRRVRSDDECVNTLDHAQKSAAGNKEPENLHVPLSYQIPAGILGNCKQTSRKHGTTYWSHKLYRGPGDKEVIVDYCRTREESENIAKLFLDKEVLGFDMEWKAFPDLGGIKNNISLIQLACEHRIALFHIALHRGETTSQLLAPTLRKILESPRITKTGVAILSADGHRLRRYMRLRPRGLMELSHLYNLVKYAATEPEKVNKSLVALARQCKEHLQLPLLKDKVRRSNWTKPLNQSQIDYAASDAYAGFMLYHVLEAKRKVLRPVPPPPGHAELGLPIRLTDEDEAAAPGSAQSRASELDEELDPVSKRLFAALRQRRNEIAKEKNIVPIVVALDRTLLRIARLRPPHVDGIKFLNGIGGRREDRYCVEWLRVVRDHTFDAQPTPSSSTSTSEEPFPSATTLNVLKTNSLSTQHLPSPPTSSPPLALDATVRPLFSALLALQIRLSPSPTSSLAQQLVAPDITLQTLANRRPRTLHEIEAILAGCEMPELARRRGVDLVAFMTRHGPAQSMKTTTTTTTTTANATATTARGDEEKFGGALQRSSAPTPSPSPSSVQAATRPPPKERGDTPAVAHHLARACNRSPTAVSTSTSTSHAQPQPRRQDGRVPLGAVSPNKQPTTQTGGTPAPSDLLNRSSDQRGCAKGAAACEVVDLTGDDETGHADAGGGNDTERLEAGPLRRERGGRTGATRGTGALRGGAAVARRSRPQTRRL